MNFDLESYLEKRRLLINDALIRYLPDEDNYPPEIYSAMRYSVFAGGKRLRPILILAAVEIVGGRVEEDALKIACAVELIHTYSLVHDDLPSMDDDDYRRGRLTCHKAYGEAIAILTGDALLTYAFELLAGISNENKNNSKTIVRIIEEVAKAAGFNGMIAGQVLDFLAENNPDMHSAATLEYIHKHKTSALFQVAIKSGGIIAGADDRQLYLLSLYAKHLGLAFQIIDDILDIEGVTSELGKSVGSDQKKIKATYPSLYGLAKSKEMAEENIKKAIESIGEFGDKAVPLIALAEFTLSRKS